MGLEELLSNPLVLLALGWLAAKWQRDQGQHTKAVQVDTELLARLKTVERWQEDHNSIHGCVRELAATVKAMANNMNRLTSRLDYWMQRMPAPPPPTARSPYEVPPDMLNLGPEDEWRT